MGYGVILDRIWAESRFCCYDGCLQYCPGFQFLWGYTVFGVEAWLLEGFPGGLHHCCGSDKACCPVSEVNGFCFLGEKNQVGLLAFLQWQPLPSPLSVPCTQSFPWTPSEPLGRRLSGYKLPAWLWLWGSVPSRLSGALPSPMSAPGMSVFASVSPWGHSKSSTYERVPFESAFVKSNL